MEENKETKEKVEIFQGIEEKPVTALKENLAKEKEAKEKNPEKDLEKKIMVILAIIFIVTAVTIILLIFRQDIDNFIKEKIFKTRFKYEGMTFDKVYNWNTIMYKTDLVFVRPETNIPIKYQFLLRNDPRLLEAIPISFNNSKIMKRTYVSLDSGISECNDSIVAAWKLGEFMGALGLNNSGAVTDYELLKNSSLGNEPDRVKTCEDAVNATVVMFQKNSETSISQEWNGKHYEDCFVLNYNNCQIVEVAERYMLFIISEVRKRNLQ